MNDNPETIHIPREADRVYAVCRPSSLPPLPSGDHQDVGVHPAPASFGDPLRNVFSFQHRSVSLRKICIKRLIGPFQDVRVHSILDIEQQRHAAEAF